MLGIGYVAFVISLFIYGIPTIVNYYGGVMTMLENRHYMMAGTFFLAVAAFLAMANFFNTYQDTQKKGE